VLTRRRPRAQEFVKKNFPGQEVVNVECQNADSDDNGYVSCTASVKDAKAVMKPVFRGKE